MVDKIIKVLPFTILVMAMMFSFGPHQFSDWFWRPQFIQNCIIGAGGRTDDRVINICNQAYARRMQLADHNWRVVEED